MIVNDAREEEEHRKMQGRKTKMVKKKKWLVQVEIKSNKIRRKERLKSLTLEKEK